MQTLSRALSPERLFAVLCATALLLAGSLATAPPSDAGICNNFGLSANCRIVFGGDKKEGDGKDTGPTRPQCHRGAPEYEGVPCQNSVVGAWSNARQCYVDVAVSQPDPTSPEWRDKGKLYSCIGLDDEGTTVIKESFWSEDEPETDEPGNLQADLERAFELKFRAMYPGLAPSPVPLQAKGQLDGWRMAPVGLWVWMWPRVPFDSQWGPIKAVDPETRYEINARVTHVKWEMGDGTTKTCDKSVPFMPYMRDRVPTCGHKYKKGGNYVVRVTTYWTIDYIDANGPGTTNLEFPQSLYVRIGENQVVNK